VTGTSGSEGGLRKRTSRKAGTAPRSDPYTKLLGPEKWTYFYLYVLIDIFSRYVPGWLLAPRETAELAERFLAETIRKQNVAGDQLTIHADRGTSMASRPVALLLADLGVTKSHSRPHCSNDNPYSEAQFKTLKYRPEFPGRFGSIEDSRAFCQHFFRWSRYAGDPGTVGPWWKSSMFGYRAP
jgi:putative transposase